MRNPDRACSILVRFPATLNFERKTLPISNNLSSPPSFLSLSTSTYFEYIARIKLAQSSSSVKFHHNWTALQNQRIHAVASTTNSTWRVLKLARVHSLLIVRFTFHEVELASISLGKESVEIGKFDLGRRRGAPGYLLYRRARIFIGTVIEIPHPHPFHFVLRYIYIYIRMTGCGNRAVFIYRRSRWTWPRGEQQVERTSH